MKMKREPEPYHLELLREVRELRKARKVPSLAMLVAANRAWPWYERVPSELTEFGISAPKAGAREALIASAPGIEKLIEKSGEFFRRRELEAAAEGRWDGTGTSNRGATLRSPAVRRPPGSPRSTRAGGVYRRVA